MPQILFNETEKLLDKWKHPDPYRPPSAPGGMTAPMTPPTSRNDADFYFVTGSKYERNLPAPDLPPPPRELVKKL